MSCCFFLYPPPGDDLLEDVGSGVGLKITVFFNNDSDEALKEEQMLQQIATDSEGKKASTRLREEYCEENLAWESSSYAEETQRCISDAGFDYDSVLPRGERLAVRRTANLHTGGTLDDVTDQLHPELIDAAVRAARALDIPVVGLDLLVPAADQPEYVFIEANERVGLANHHPQPTAERFVDLLFPLSYGTH